MLCCINSLNVKNDHFTPRLYFWTQFQTTFLEISKPNQQFHSKKYQVLIFFSNLKSLIVSGIWGVIYQILGVKYLIDVDPAEVNMAEKTLPLPMLQIQFRISPSILLLDESSKFINLDWFCRLGNFWMLHEANFNEKNIRTVSKYTIEIVAGKMYLLH